MPKTKRKNNRISTFEGIEGFKSADLKKTETVEKSQLPASEDIKVKDVGHPGMC